MSTRQKKSKRGKVLKILTGIVAVFLILFYFWIVYPFWGMPFNAQRHGNPPLTPAWALECWLWEDDVNTAEYVDSLLTGYKKHDIPVRTIILDSPWTWRYNDFDMDTLRYPNPDIWFSRLQDDGYRLVLWMTPNINSFSKDAAIKDSKSWYEGAKKRGYLADNGRIVSWWKGKGGYIDYSNPQAMKWWHGLQDRVFQLGIDGWKLDGSATLFFGEFLGIPVPYFSTHDGLMTIREYMDHYYRDEYQFGLTKNPEFITLSRSMDRGFHPEGFSPIDASPVNWVGDQKHTWKSSGTKLDKNSPENKDLAMNSAEGIEEAIHDILKSAEMGYSVIGSDVAGFSGRTIPKRLYIRWAQFSTFCGLFMNGGHGNRALWERSKEELEIIRKFSWMHTELIPYMYSYVVSAHNGGTRLQRPVEGKYHYMFGDYLLVAPIYEDTYKRDVTLPPGKWRYLFHDQQPVDGNQKLLLEFPLDEFPVFVKEGAIIPMNISRSYNGFGSDSSSGYITYLIYPHEKESRFTLHYPDKSGKTDITVKDDGQKINIKLSGLHKAHILRIYLSEEPKNITLDDKKIKAYDWHFVDDENKLIIKTDNYEEGNYLIEK